MSAPSVDWHPGASFSFFAGGQKMKYEKFLLENNLLTFSLQLFSLLMRGKRV